MDTYRPKQNAAFNISWLLKMAWRDSRRNRSRLFLFVSSIVLGIAALVAIYSFGYNLEKDIDNQAKTLLGADLAIYSNQQVKPGLQKLLDTLGQRRSQERSFASMVYFPSSKGTRLVQVRALAGDFPYYGVIETSPARAQQTFRQGRQALVDKTLMLQYRARVGDSVRVGNLNFAIAGILHKAPDQSGLMATVAPAVYIPLQDLPQTGLVQKGSRINYRFYFQFPPGTKLDKLVKKLEPRLERDGLSYETIASKKRNTGEAFEDLTRFLTLVGFIALLLGCIGVASAIHIYVREKLPTIAVLRCLGVRSSQAVLIYLFQILGIGLLGSLLGAGLGSVVQRLLPEILAELLPLRISWSLSWLAIGQGLLLGVLISLLFALLPLISIRNISPLNTLRLSYEHPHLRQDPWKWVIYGLIFLFIFGFTFFQTETWKQAMWFSGGVLLAFLLLCGAAYALMWLTRRYFPASWGYLWRQGFANLYRPNNQTLILVVSIGLGTAFICTLFFTQKLLIDQVSLSSRENQPNMVLFDIQTNQKDQVVRLTRRHQLPVLQQVPVVNMRLEEINGLTGADVRADTSLQISPRAFTREYRVTYRDSLIDSEKLTAGNWSGHAANLQDPIPISLEEDFARRIRVQLGDTLLFNVQGALMPTVVGSLRKIEWNRVQTNFLVVFPAGVLEAAPQFHVLMTRVPSQQASARFQQALVEQFPTISVIDLDLILNTLDELLDKIAFVIRFMATFSILTGVIVLIASVLISKYQRIQESVLLRTLGASRRQILVITGLEYAFLGMLAAATGIVLAFGGSWALARFSFEIPFRPQLWPVLVLFGLVVALTVTIGLLNSRGILQRPPLEVLRSEV